jgi:hypothetical protein
MKKLIVLLGLIIGLGAITLSCRNDYKDKYIHLLEEHVNSLNQQPVASEPEEESVFAPLLVEDVQREAMDYFHFLCGDDSNLLDYRVRLAGEGKWIIIYRIKTQEIDEFGFNIERSIAITGFEWNGQLRFDDATLKLKLCD